MILASFTLVFSFILLNIVILPNSSWNTKYIHTKNSQSSPVWWMTNNLLKSTLCFFFRLCDETFCCENERSICFYFFFFGFWKEIDKLALRWLFWGSSREMVNCVCVKYMDNGKSFMLPSFICIRFEFQNGAKFNP